MHAVGDFTHVVRRDVRGHADRDAGRPVDEQVREARRQYGGLLRLAVIVRHKIDGVFVDVAHEFHRERGHAAFGVTHGGGRVVAGGAEVALAVHEQVAHRPILRHAHQGVVDRGIAVRVVLAHHVAHDARALVVAAVGAAVVHRIDHAAVHRLHAVAHVGQRAFHNHGKRVRKIRLAHLFLQVDGLHAVALEQAVVGVVRFLRAERFECAGVQRVLVVGAICAGVGGFVCQLKSFTLVFRSHSKNARQASIQRALCALRWMNRRRGSTSSPMSIENVSSACSASSMCTCLSTRLAGSIVVSHSSW